MSLKCILQGQDSKNLVTKVELNEHIADKNNPHKVTAEQVGAMHDYGLITPENLQTWVSEQKFSGTFLLTSSTTQGVPKPQYWFGEFIIISKDTFNDFAIYLFTDAEFYCCVTSGGQWSNSWLQIHPNKYHTNPNLLDNWYFPNPVNQRNGYIIPKDTIIYSDSSLSESSKIGPATYACIVVESASTYVKVRDIKLPDNYYYAAVSAAIQGYIPAQNGYSIDRWSVEADNELVITFVDDGIHLKNIGNKERQFKQILPINPSLSGLTVTTSVLCDNVVGSVHCVLSQVSSPYQNSTTCWLTRAGLFSDSGSVLTGQQKIIIGVASGAEITIKAVKLELGDTQTLAHKEGDTWVLNEIPDYGEQLRRCQRFFQRHEINVNAFIPAAMYGGELMLAHFFIPLLTKMRTVPTATVQNNGRFVPATGNVIFLNTTPQLDTRGSTEDFAAMTVQFDALSAGTSGWVDSFGHIDFSADL